MNEFILLDGSDLKFGANQFDIFLLRHLSVYDVPTWFKGLASIMFWMMAMPWLEEIRLEKHWQNINRILEPSTTSRGFETNEHRGLLVVQKR